MKDKKTFITEASLKIFIEGLNSKIYSSDSDRIYHSVEMAEFLGDTLGRYFKKKPKDHYINCACNYYHGISIKNPENFEFFMNKKAVDFLLKKTSSVRLYNAVELAQKRYNRVFKIIEVYEYGDGFRNFGKQSMDEFKEMVNEEIKKQNNEATEQNN